MQFLNKEIRVKKTHHIIDLQTSMWMRKKTKTIKTSTADGTLYVTRYFLNEHNRSKPRKTQTLLDNTLVSEWNI